MTVLILIHSINQFSKIEYEDLELTSALYSPPPQQILKKGLKLLKYVFPRYALY